MTRLLLALVLFAAAVGVALVLRRRRTPDVPTQPRFLAPVQLDRADFDGADTPWLVVTFTSATCHTCADMARKAAVLTSPQVAVQDVEVGARPELHRKYGIEAVPITVVADPTGVVRASFVGPVSATDLWAAVADAREPGGAPRHCEGHGAATAPEP